MLKQFILLCCLLSLWSYPAYADCTPQIVSLAIVDKQIPLAKVAYKGSLYQLVQITGKRDNEVFMAIYREKGSHCWIAYADHGGDSVSLAEGVPRPVAIAFAKQFVKGRIEKFGTAETIAWYSKYERLSPEDAAALTELKIVLPSVIPVSPWPEMIQHETKVK
jgi:hypothetical protein